MNTSAFTGLATILTAAVVILIYFQQKRDKKVQAARVLLLEVRTAEDRIDQIKEKVQSRSIGDLPSVFTTSSWDKYSHLFISDFDQDELSLINSFYNYGSLVEDFAKRNNNFFWITTEERAKVTQRKLADIITEVAMGSDGHKKDALISSILDDYMNDRTSYTPQKTLDEIKNYTDKIENITTSSVGTKLKRLANLDTK